MDVDKSIYLFFAPQRFLKSGGAYDNQIFRIVKCLNNGVFQIVCKGQLVLIPKYPPYPVLPAVLCRSMPGQTKSLHLLMEVFCHKLIQICMPVTDKGIIKIFIRHFPPIP